MARKNFNLTQCMYMSDYVSCNHRSDKILLSEATGGVDFKRSHHQLDTKFRYCDHWIRC